MIQRILTPFTDSDKTLQERYKKRYMYKRYKNLKIFIPWTYLTVK